MDIPRECVDRIYILMGQAKDPRQRGFYGRDFRGNNPRIIYPSLNVIANSAPGVKTFPAK